MKRFLILAVALILSGWFLNAIEVNAAGCVGGSVTGVCKPQGCGADEIDANSLTLSYQDAFPSGNCQGTCCVAKGQVLCGAVASAAKQSGSFTCTKPCSGTPLTTYAGAVGETCGGDTVCCNAPPPSGGTPSGTPSKGSSGSPITLTNPLGAGTTLFTVINRVISAFLGMVGALALGVFVYAGVTWMTAGSSDRVQKAKDAMKYAVIGLLMIAFSYAITNFLLNALIRDSAAQQQQGPEVQEAVPLGE